MNGQWMKQIVNGHRTSTLDINLRMIVSSKGQSQENPNTCIANLTREEQQKQSFGPKLNLIVSDNLEKK